MTPTTEKPAVPPSSSFWHQILFRYKWMSLRNKIALWTVIVVVICTAISLQWIRPAYRGVKMLYFLNLAEGLVEKKDYSAASMAYRKALLCGHDRPESWKSLAKFLEQIDSSEIINVWEKLAVLEPNVREHRFKQAAAAIKFGRGSQAQAILDKVPEGWRNDPAYLRNIVDIAIRKNQLDVAEQLLGRLLHEHPGDEKATFDLELVRIKSKETAKRIEAIRKLEEIGRSTSKFAPEALRKLTSAAAETKDYVEADRLATKLIALPNATIRDRLLHLHFELISQSLSATSSLKNLRTYVEQHPGDFEPMIDWMLANKIDSEGTSAWVKSLPPEFTNLPQVQSGLLQFYLNIADFKEVFRILQARQKDLDLRSNVLELAEKAINERDNHASNADRTWMEAVYRAEGSPPSLYYLSLIASAKGWVSATGRALSSLADSVPDQPGVWSLLAKHESSTGNLPGYYKALSGLMHINPYNVSISSDWVLASVLLNRGRAVEILDVAKRTYDMTEPADPWAVTAYAMALLWDERPQQALTIINRMSESNRLLPQRAIYVGAVLAASGHQKEALEYFERSEGFAGHDFSEELTLRRIWKGVALGEATTAQEQERLLAARGDLQAESEKVRLELQKQLDSRRSDSAEMQSILSELKKTTSRQVSPDVEKLLRDFRDRSEKKQPAQP